MIVLGNPGVLGTVAICMVAAVWSIWGAFHILQLMIDDIIFPLATLIMSLLIVGIKIIHKVAITIISVTLATCYYIYAHILQFLGIRNADEYMDEKIRSFTV